MIDFTSWKVWVAIILLGFFVVWLIWGSNKSVEYVGLGPLVDKNRKTRPNGENNYLEDNEDGVCYDKE